MEGIQKNEENKRQTLRFRKYNTETNNNKGLDLRLEAIDRSIATCHQGPASELPLLAAR